MGEMARVEIIEQKIFMVRGHRGMLDKDLAGLYGVKTRDLNKAVTRNLDHFPEDFMFQLNKEEFNNFEVPFWNIKMGWYTEIATRFY